MTNLKALSDKELLSNTLKIVKKEKQFTALALEYLQEVETRKLYCDQGLPSLFAYCTQVLGYSEAEASVRVNATRLIRSIPEVKKDVASGELNLTNLSLTQRFFNENNTLLDEKKEILNQIRGKSSRETKKILNEKSTKKLRTIKLILSEKLLLKLKKVQKYLDNCSELQALEILIDQFIEKKKADRPHRKTSKASSNQRYITRKAKEAVYMRAHGQCEYVCPESNTRCCTRTNLQFDHIRPIALGGNSQEENLRLLYFNHNQRMRIKAKL